MRHLFCCAAIAALALATEGCSDAINPLNEAERLTKERNYSLALKCADDCASRIDTMSQPTLCRLTVAYFRISEAARADGDSVVADSAFRRFQSTYRASLTPDTALATDCYFRVNLHVPAMFEKYGLEVIGN